MARFSRPQKTWQLIVLVIAVVATIVARMNRQPPQRGGDGGGSGSPRTERKPPATERRHAGWERLENCVLVDDRTNDGDSFTLSSGGETHTFRLYFADCPEKYRHQYNGDRLAQQGEYFGGLNEEQTIEAGVEAKDFALGLLEKGPVTVETKWEEVYDSGRMYAFVRVGNQDLAEVLVSRGLARIHTKGAARVDGTPERTQKDRLYQLEREARGQRRGAWGAGGNGLKKKR